MSEYYILDADKNVVSTDDMKEWGQMFNDTDNRRVDQTKLKDDVTVSTIFIGLDHQYGNGPPLLFETMVFGGDWDEHQWRFSTWHKSQVWHDTIVAVIKNGLKPQEAAQD